MATSWGGRPQVLRRSRQPIEGVFCGYTHRECTQPRLDGLEFCIKHILEDKNSPYKQCNYMSNKTGKRCTNAAPKSDKREGFCSDHAKRALLARQRSGRHLRPRETPQSLLEELDCYAPRGPLEGNGGDGMRRTRSVDNLASKILEYASSSESDMDTVTVETVWKGDGDSDADSVDSEQEDPLKHAGVYTAEEVALITRDKLIRLQSLYIDQFKRLQQVMREKRRRYLHNVRREREALGSIHFAKDDPEQRNNYDKLTAMKRYHKRHGKEALLHRQSKERRIEVSEGTSYRPPSYPKCIHSRMGVKCGARTVPLSKYCFTHVLCEPHQVLFQRCNFADMCGRPVSVACENASCSYHAAPQPLRYRLPGKKERDSDDCKEELQIDVVGEDVPMMAQPPQLLCSHDVKQESDVTIKQECDVTKPLEQPMILSDEANRRLVPSRTLAPSAGSSSNDPAILPVLKLKDR